MRQVLAAACRAAAKDVIEQAFEDFRERMEQDPAVQAWMAAARERALADAQPAPAPPPPKRQIRPVGGPFLAGPTVYLVPRSMAPAAGLELGPAAAAAMEGLRRRLLESADAGRKAEPGEDVVQDVTGDGPFRIEEGLNANWAPCTRCGNVMCPPQRPLCMGCISEGEADGAPADPAG